MGPFDIHALKELVGLMTQHGLVLLDLRGPDQRVRLRRRPSAPAPAAVPEAAPVTLTAPAGKVMVKSPMAGVFFGPSGPGLPPRVAVGSRVVPDTVIGAIEADSTFNEINAGCSGVVTAVLARDGFEVRYGDTLIELDPASEGTP